MHTTLETWLTSERSQLLERQREPAYLLSPRGFAIEWVNTAFVGCCTAHDGGSDLPRRVLGRSLLEFVPAALRDFYQGAYAKVLASGVPARHDYECSSLGQTRWYAQYILPDHGRLAILNTLLSSVGREHPEPVSDWGPYLGQRTLVTQCSHCRRVKNRATGCWELHADVFEPDSGTPPMSHGLCEVCFEYFFASEDLGPALAEGAGTENPSAFRWLAEDAEPPSEGASPSRALQPNARPDPARP